MRRSNRGHGIIELGIVAVLFTMFAVFCADIGIVIMGSGLNERACRDAARAAAQADSYASSLRLAQAAVRSHRGDGYWVTSPQVDPTSFIYEDFAGSPPPNTSPYVSVTTTSEVRIPAPAFFAGAEFAQNGKMQFTKTYIFPIVKTKLYL